MTPIHPNKAYIQYPNSNKQIRTKKPITMRNISQNSFIIVILAFTMELNSTHICDSYGIRTHDPNIKSVVLYQLS